MSTLSDRDPAVRCTAIEALAGSVRCAVPTSRRGSAASWATPTLRSAPARPPPLSHGGPGRREDGHLVWRAVLDDDATTADALMAAAVVPSAALVPDLIGLVRRGQETPASGTLSVRTVTSSWTSSRGGSTRGRQAPVSSALTTAASRGGGERGGTLLLAALLDPRPDIAEAAATGLHRVRATAPAQAVDTRARNAVATAVDRQLDRAHLVVNGLAALEGVEEVDPLQGSAAGGALRGLASYPARRDRRPRHHSGACHCRARVEDDSTRVSRRSSSTSRSGDAHRTSSPWSHQVCTRRRAAPRREGPDVHGNRPQQGRRRRAEGRRNGWR